MLEFGLLVVFVGGVAAGTGLARVWYHRRVTESVTTEAR